MTKPRLIRKTKKFIAELVRKYYFDKPYEENEFGFFYFIRQKKNMANETVYTYCLYINPNGDGILEEYNCYSDMVQRFANYIKRYDQVEMATPKDE